MNHRGLSHHRVGHWRRVHRHAHVSGSVGLSVQQLRFQLPPDGPNFAFVQSGGGSGSPNFSYAAFPKSLESKLSVDAWESIRAMVSKDIPAVPSMPLFCLLIPILGCILLAQRNEEYQNNLIEGVAKGVEAANQYLLSVNGTNGLLVVQYLDYNGLRGLVLEVPPVNSDGTPNPLWSGQLPIMGAEITEVVQLSVAVALGQPVNAGALAAALDAEVDCLNTDEAALEQQVIGGQLAECPNCATLLQTVKGHTQQQCGVCSVIFPVSASTGIPVAGQVVSEGEGSEGSEWSEGEQEMVQQPTTGTPGAGGSSKKHDNMSTPLAHTPRV